MLASYGYHQTKVGNVILCLMDVVDLFLPLAKIFKYVGLTTLCDATFVVFIITWFLTRHVGFMIVCWSVFHDIPIFTNYGCYRGSDSNLEGPLPVPNDWNHLIQPFYDPEGLVCFNENIKWCFLSLLLSLQVILLGWFTMIIRIAYKFINGQNADDVRSDEEDSEEATDEVKKSFLLSQVPEPADKSAYIEQDVDAQDMHFSSSSRHQGKGTGGRKASPARRSKVRGDSSAATTAVSLRPGDRKELLGRIGCDKGA